MSIRSTTLAALLAGTALPALAQEVILDRQVRAGPLTLFPSVRDATQFYYAPTDARLALHEDGTPQFSFTRYIAPSQGEEASDLANATGVVHAVVELGVSEEDVEAARDAIGDVVPGATILGPVTFTQGTFALVSSYAEEGSDVTERVVGVGNMPLLEGDRAAISLRLTRQGTLELWEGFARATPDISFSFSTEIDGFRAPQQAILTADFERIYAHESFEAGVATPYLQAEIEGAFDDLRRSGAIQLTQIGGDAQMQALIDTAYARLIDIIFENTESTGLDSINQLQATAGGQNDTSMLDKASALLNANRTATAAENEAIRDRNAERAAPRAEAAAAQSTLSDTRRRASDATAAAEELRARAETSRRERDAASTAADAAEAAGEDETATAAREVAERFDAQITRYEAMAQDKEAEAEALQADLAEQETTAAEAGARAEAAGELETPQSTPSIAVVASYRMKEVRESGSYEINLNKYMADSLALRFDENIGDMTDWRDDVDVFATVDLADTAARQREVPVFIDGLNATDFGDFVNFASVVLEKERDGAADALDEIRVDRENFQQSANDFRLVYTKLTDGEDADFLDYRYRVHWNLFGGVEVEGDWIDSDASGIGIAPPYQRRTIYLEADPDIVADEGIRSIEFRLYYDLAGEERMERVSLRPDAEDGEDLSAQLDFIQPRGVYDYAYEIDWRLRGGGRRSSGRIESRDGTIFVDEMPLE
ncbi:hypothetical protein [Roseobacter sp. HKCCA0434]|uniref:hypothetical protein n=1 Tax=Roseobacter sp. HKCCA0434 TaxID=3079297 RepID=UPI002905DFD6|nr:hypothetical protein [Roseobacter sp. HKCCA0434]